MVKLTCPRSTSRDLWHSMGIEPRSRSSRNSHIKYHYTTDPTGLRMSRYQKEVKRNRQKYIMKFYRVWTNKYFRSTLQHKLVRAPELPDDMFQPDYRYLLVKRNDFLRFCPPALLKTILRTSFPVNPLFCGTFFLREKALEVALFPTSLTSLQ